MLESFTEEFMVLRREARDFFGMTGMPSVCGESPQGA